MEKVWRCNHCSKIFDFDKISEAEEHEAGCVFNIANQTCYTCMNMFDDGAPISGPNNACKQGHSCFDREEEDFAVKCDDYL
jgi:hypothetical protein